MCLASLLRCLVLSRWLEKVKEGEEHMPWGFLSRSEHVPRAHGELRLVC